MIWSIDEWDTPFYDVYMDGVQVFDAVSVCDDLDNGMAIFADRADRPVAWGEPGRLAYSTQSGNVAVRGKVHVCLRDTPDIGPAYRYVWHSLLSELRVYVFEIVHMHMDNAPPYKNMCIMTNKSDGPSLAMHKTEVLSHMHDFIQHDLAKKFPSPILASRGEPWRL